MYMLDTNIVSAVIRGRSDVDRRLLALDPSDWCVSVVTEAELLYGLARRPEARLLARTVKKFLESAQILPWDSAAALQHGKLRANLHEQGTPIGEYDSLIAAHALATHRILVTDNMAEFTRVRGLEVENWIERTA